ncbi:MAG: NUDIX domain-containing protein [Candidatus Marsarchaeota archaeon]|jgi:ADP-ribose pyrophosphatase YjhB (NUDIX family)|nr:NUDIX domain-containing protein [Candidatus Marsarchaeota archaeon]
MKRFTVKAGSWLVLRKGGNVLMIKRKNTGWHDGDYALVSGHLEPGETLREAMAREAKEEVGISISIKDLKPVHVMQKTDGIGKGGDYVVVFFEAHRWKGIPRNMEPDRCSDVVWFDLKKLPENTVPLARHALKMIDDGKPYSEFGFA